jgi:hypothetical protein
MLAVLYQTMQKIVIEHISLILPQDAATHFSFSLHDTTTLSINDGRRWRIKSAISLVGDTYCEVTIKKVNGERGSVVG